MPIDPLAAIALIISLVSLGFSVEARIRDRYKLSCVSYMVTSNDHDCDEGHETYSIKVVVTNLGRRPVAVVEVTYESHHEDLSQRGLRIFSFIYGGLVASNENPIDLTENQTRSFSTSELTRENMLIKTKRIDVLVQDSRGKIYKNTIENDAYSGAEIEAETINLQDEA